MQYKVQSQFIPNSNYRCTWHECPWSAYIEGADWGFYKENGGDIDSCEICMSRCDMDPACGSVECGPDQNLPDGTVLSGHCSWWRKGFCETAAEFSTNPANYIWTCKKQRKIHHFRITTYSGLNDFFNILTI